VCWSKPPVLGGAQYFVVVRCLEMDASKIRL
jgi:hypothetical protein